MIFICPILDQKYSSWENLVQKIEMWCLNQFDYFEYYYDVHLFCFELKFGQIWTKRSKLFV